MDDGVYDPRRIVKSVRLLMRRVGDAHKQKQTNGLAVHKKQCAGLELEENGCYALK